MSSGIIDMSQLPAPLVVQQVDYETILAEMKTDFLQAYPHATAALRYESDPLHKWLERQAYDKMLWRQRQNEDAHAVMLAYAKGADLDNLGAFYQVERLVITPADESTVPPTPAVMEGDADFRARIQMAPSSFSVAGPEDAYLFYAKSACGLVLDVTATSPEPGSVVITVLSREGTGEASAELLQLVDAAVNAKERRPLTDQVLTQSAVIVPYAVRATVYLKQGPDTSIVKANVQESGNTYAQLERRINKPVSISAIYAALHIDGVDHADIIEPVGNIDIHLYEAPWCTGIELTWVTL